MGTRGLTIVKLGGKTKIAQYGQWDHYPTGQGETIRKFLKTKLKMKSFINSVSQLKFATDEDLTKVENTTNWKEQYPQFSRDIGANILEMVQKGTVNMVHDSSEFLKDGLFCEYAYELDLDNKNITIYVGGTKYKTYTFTKFKSMSMKALEKELNEG